MLKITFYSIVAILMYGVSIVHAQEISIREILEQKTGAKIDTFYYTNYADAVNEIDFDHGLEPKDCFSGIVVLQYKGVEKWDIYKYDFTELFSSILNESNTGEDITTEMGDNYETTNVGTIFKQMYNRLKELTIDTITEHIDTMESIKLLEVSTHMTSLYIIKSKWVCHQMRKVDLSVINHVLLLLIFQIH